MTPKRCDLIGRVNDRSLGDCGVSLRRKEIPGNENHKRNVVPCEFLVVSGSSPLACKKGIEL